VRKTTVLKKVRLDRKHTISNQIRQTSPRQNQSELHYKGVRRISFQGGGLRLIGPSPAFSPPPSLPLPPLLFPSLSLPFLPSPPLPLEVGPFDPARGSGGVKLPQRVRAESDRQAIFGAFWAEKSCW